MAPRNFQQQAPPENQWHLQQQAGTAAAIGNDGDAEDDDAQRARCGCGCGCRGPGGRRVSIVVRTIRDTYLAYVRSDVVFAVASY